MVLGSWNLSFTDLKKNKTKQLVILNWCKLISMFSGALPAFAAGKSEPLLPLDLHGFSKSFVTFAPRWSEIMCLNAKPSLDAGYFIS